MLKIVSENFIHALLLFLGLFLKISRWVPLSVDKIPRCEHSNETSLAVLLHYINVKGLAATMRVGVKSPIQ